MQINILIYRYVEFALYVVKRATRNAELLVYPFYIFGSKWVWVDNATFRALRPRERNLGGWVDFRASQDGREKSRPQWHSTVHTLL